MNNIREVFIKTVDPNISVRKNAEAELKKIERDPNALLHIFKDLINDPDHLVKQTSSLFLANKIKEFYGNEDIKPLTDLIETKFVELFASTNEKFKLNSFTKILIAFYDKRSTEKVLEVLTMAGKAMMVNDEEMIKSGLMIFEKVFKSEALKFSLKPMFEVMFNQYGKIFISRFEEAVNSGNSNISRLCQKIVLKSYGHYAIPTFLLSLDVFQKLYQISLTIISQGDKNIREIGTNPSSMKDKSVEWFAYRFIYRSFTKGIKKIFKNPEIVEYLSSGENIENVTILFYKVTQDYVNGIERDSGIYETAASFFNFMFSKTKTKQYVISHSEYLLYNFILPGVKYDDEVEMLFDCDIEKYLQERYSFSSYELRHSLGELFSAIIATNNELLNKTMRSLINHLVDPNYDIKVKYGIVELLSDTQKECLEVLGKKDFNLLVSQIIFGFLNTKNPDHLFMVSQALYFMSSSEDIIIDNAISFDTMSFIHNLIENNENEIIKVEACLAMNFFFFNSDLYPHLKDFIPFLLSKILSFNQKYFLESLSNLMEGIVSNFPEYVNKYSVEFSTSLILNIEKILKDDSKFVTINEYIQTLVTLINSNTDNKETVKAIFHRSSNFLYEIFSNESLYDHFQEALDLLNTAMYNLDEVDNFSYELLKAVFLTDKDELVLYNKEIITLIDNFVSFGDNSLFTQEIILNISEIFDVFLIDSTDEIYEEDFYCACELINSLLLYKGQFIVSSFPSFISDVIFKIVRLYPLVEQSTNKAQVLSLEVIMNLFTISTQFTISKLTSFNFLDYFFDEVTKHYLKFTRVVDKKIFILFMGALFKIEGNTNDVNSAAINKSIIDNLNIKNINEAFAETFGSLSISIVRRNNLIKIEEEGEEPDWEEDEFDDDVLMEDIYVETPLDKFDVYQFVKQMLSSIVPNSFGQKAISSMDKFCINRINETLESPQEAQKVSK